MQLIKLTVPFVLASLVAGLPAPGSKLQIRDDAAVEAPVDNVLADGSPDVEALLHTDFQPTNLPPLIPDMPVVDPSDASAVELLTAIEKNVAVPAALTKRTVSCLFNLPSTLGNWAIPQGLTYNKFLNWPYFSKTAKAAPSTLLGGKYNIVYRDLKASYKNPDANTYLTSTTHWDYRPEVCASKCEKIEGCMSFDIYFERDPLVTPQPNTWLADPPGVTNIVCDYYGVPISADLATDAGETIAKFQVAKAGVNGYKLPFKPLVKIPGYNGAIRKGLVDNRVSTGSGSDLGPEYAHYDTYSIIFTYIFKDNAFFDPNICKKEADKLPEAKSFSTWPVTVGGDANSTPYAGAGGRYAGQGCIVYSAKGFPEPTFNDAGQYGHDEVTGKEGAFFSHAPNYHYDQI